MRWLSALLISLVLHYWIFSALLSSTVTGTLASPSGTPHMVVRVVPPEPDNSAASLQAADASPPAHPPSPANVSATPPATSRPLASVPLPRDPAATRFDPSIRFYTIEEVDQPAHPRLDWALPMDNLVAAGLRRLVIQIWILDNGKVLDVDIISATPAVLREQDKRNLVKWLIQTEVAPAIKGVKRVASKRTLEIAFDL